MSRSITLGDLLPEDKVKAAWRIMSQADDDATVGDIHRRLVDEVLTDDVMAKIDAATHQKNDRAYLAYALQGAYLRASAAAEQKRSADRFDNLKAKSPTGNPTGLTPVELQTAWEIGRDADASDAEIEEQLVARVFTPAVVKRLNDHFGQDDDAAFYAHGILKSVHAMQGAGLGDWAGPHPEATRAHLN